jgi:hypothetical protein
MVQFKLKALHVPSQEFIEYGPWDTDPDPVKAHGQLSFAYGFICGWHSNFTQGQGEPSDLAFEVIEIPDEPPTAIVGVVTAYASATVTHADGTTD